MGPQPRAEFKVHFPVISFNDSDSLADQDPEVKPSPFKESSMWGKYGIKPNKPEAASTYTVHFWLQRCLDFLPPSCRSYLMSARRGEKKKKLSLIISQYKRHVFTSSASFCSSASAFGFAFQTFCFSYFTTARDQRRLLKVLLSKYVSVGTKTKKETWNVFTQKSNFSTKPPPNQVSHRRPTEVLINRWKKSGGLLCFFLKNLSTSIFFFFLRTCCFKLQQSSCSLHLRSSCASYRRSALSRKLSSCLCR